MTAPTDDGLELRVDVSRFRDARDVVPRPATLTWSELESLVAPVRPPVREDLVRDELKRLHLVELAVGAVLADVEPDPWLADHPTFRAIEKVAWTAGDTPEAREAAVHAAATDASDRVRRSTKTRLPCWSPVRCHPGATRGIPAVEHVTCLVLDYDDGTSLEAAVEAWTDWPLFVATTWSHTLDAPRFRVVLPLDRPVPAEAWPAAWQWAADRAAGQVDPACKDPSRLYLLPALRSRDAPYQRLLHDPGGHLLALDWERLPEAAAPPPSTGSSRPSPCPPTGSKRPTDAARAQARVLFKQDEPARRRAADWLGARITERRADRVPCPACGRPSAWFWLSPGALSTAQCHHKASCGWWGHLDELLDAQGSPHAG